MALPFAEVSDLVARLGRDLDDTEAKRAEAAISDASDLVRSEARRDSDWVNPVAVPAVARAIALASALRVMRNPEGYVSETVGPYNVQRDRGQSGAYLLDEEKAILARLRPSGKRPLWTLSTTRGDCYSDTVFYEDSYGCELFPLESHEDFGR